MKIVCPMFKTEVSKAILNATILLGKIAQFLDPEIWKIAETCLYGKGIPSLILVHELLAIEI